MGNSNSSTLSTKLYELGDLACQLGDDSVGKSLKSISGSPDDIKSLRAVVTAGIKTPQIGSRKIWFQNFTSDDGKKLSKKEVSSLVSITSGWELNNESLKTMQEDISKWSETPSTFFPSNQHGMNAIQEAYEDVENIEETAQPRRRFRLIQLHYALHEKEGKLRSEYKKNHRRRNNNEKQDEGKKLRSLALAEMVGEICGPLPLEMLKEKKKKLAKRCRGGERWANIEHKGLMLAHRKINNKSFEQKRLSDLQLRAINVFVSSIFSVEDLTMLQRAYKAIYEHSRRRNRKRKASSTRITNKRVRRDGVSQASDPSDAPGCYEQQQDSEEQSEPDCDDTFSDATSQSISSDTDGFVEGEVEGDIDRDQDTDFHQQTSLLADPETLRIQNPAPQGVWEPLSQTIFPSQSNSSNSEQTTSPEASNFNRTNTFGDSMSDFNNMNMDSYSNTNPDATPASNPNPNDPNTCHQSTNTTVPGAAYLPGSFDTNPVFPGTPYQPGSFDTSSTVPSAPYQPALFDTNLTIPGTPVSLKTNPAVPVAPYQPGSFDTNFRVPYESYRSGYNSSVLGNVAA